MIFAAVYLLWMYGRVMFGPRTNPKNEGMADLNAREWAVFAPILILIFWMGLFPGAILDRIEPAVGKTLTAASATVTPAARKAQAPAPSPTRRLRQPKAADLFKKLRPVNVGNLGKTRRIKLPGGTR